MSEFAGEHDWVNDLGSCREVVRQRLVAEQLNRWLGGRPGLRVLDVGCGQGTQALILARAGCLVTGLDVSADLLRRFGETVDAEPEPVRGRIRLVQGSGEDAGLLTPGPFDVVLCHGVLMYLAEEQPMLASLSAVAAENATMSLLVRNGLAPAMRDGLRGNWQAAEAAFDSRDHTTRSGVTAHGHTPGELNALMEAHGWTPVEWYGIRVFTDHLQQPPPDEHELLRLLAAERRAGASDPYRRVAGLLHCLYRR